MVLPKNAAKRCATLAKFEGISPTQALEALVAFAYDAWLDSRVARAAPTPASQPSI
jgi:hypothetical protein